MTDSKISPWQGERVGINISQPTCMFDIRLAAAESLTVKDAAGVTVLELSLSRLHGKRVHIRIDALEDTA